LGRLQPFRTGRKPKSSTPLCPIQGAGENTQRKSDVPMKWTSRTGKRWIKNHQYSILVPTWCQNTMTHHDP
jgi:hypothetical protein